MSDKDLFDRPADTEPSESVRQNLVGHFTGRPFGEAVNRRAERCIPVDEMEASNE